MTFNDKKAIYLQVADLICDNILQGKSGEEERIPSVRETAAEVEVNSNTVMRSYDWLQNHQIIYTKRGLGYFVSPDAKSRIMAMRREEFFEESVPELVRTMRILGITTEELTEIIGKANGK